MKKTDEQKEYEILLANVRDLLRTRSGQDVLWHILSLCGIYSTAFTGNSQTFFNEGKRAIGLEVLDLINQADPEAYANMLKSRTKKLQGV